MSDLNLIDLSLAELFDAAAKIPDHRTPEEKEAICRAIAKAQAEIGEVIGYPEVEQ